MNHYRNKIAIVTGGGSGIGKAICVYLAQHGAKVVIADLKHESAQQVEAQILTLGGQTRAVAVDVTRPQDVQSLIEDTVKAYGQIDYLFNNAGIGINGEFQDMSLEQWRHILDVNLWGTVYGCHYAYPIMMKQGCGHIINTSSLGGLIPGGLMTSYSAAKHAVVGLSLTLRAEAKQYGIKVSALCPGFMTTNIQKASPNVSVYLDSEKNKRMGAGKKYPTPEQCINQIMRGVAKNKAIIVSPIKHKVFWWMYRLFPGLIPYMWSRIIGYLKK
jgi:NAD(P)-dependent dehydrogenase (short-subunit alcohol dehydrogenase family)